MTGFDRRSVDDRQSGKRPQIEWVNSRATALARLRDVVRRAKATDSMAQVTVLAPDNLAGIVARRYLATGVLDGSPGVAAVDVTTLDRLAEQIAARSLGPRRPLTAPILTAACRRALTAEPGMFADVADHPATVQALVSACRSLRDADESGLEAIHGLGGLPAETIRLHREVRQAVREDWYDAHDLLDAAAAQLADHDLGEVVLYLPQELSPAQARFAAALAEHARSFTVIGEVSGVRRADAAVLRWLGQAGVEPPTVPTPRTATRVLNASDSDDEVRCVVREVVEALRTTPAHRIAVLYSRAKPYARLLQEQLAVAGLTVNGAGNRPVAERALARALLGLLALPDSDTGRAELFSVLSSVPARDFSGDRIPVARWERTSRNAGVVGGDDWVPRLERLVEIETTEIANQRGSDDPQEWRIERSQHAIASAEGLARFVARLRAELQQAESMTTWFDLARWSAGLFRTVLAPEASAHLPAEEQYAAAAIVSALEGLGSLDGIDGAASLVTVREALELTLTSTLPRVGRFGDGVHVGPLSSAVGLDLDVVYVVGLSEDLYPGRLHEDALLPERVREASRGQLPSARDAVDRQHRHFLAALSAAPTSVVSFPRGDLRRSAERIPSRFLLPTLRRLSDDERLPATRWQTADYGEAMTTSGSFAGALRQTALLAQEQEWRTRQAESGGTLDDAVVEAGAAMLEARAGDALSRFDGNLTGQVGLPDYPVDHTLVSPTALESYASCPHAFFVRRLLGVQPLEQPEEIVEVAPSQVGTLMHEVVDRFVKDQQGRGRLPGHGTPWTDDQRARLVTIAHEQADELERHGVTGHPRLWRRERQRILADLQWMLDDDDVWRAQEVARILASELRFGFDGVEPVPVVVPRGSVLLRGSADRVDQTSDGGLVVTDLKTGSARTFKEIGPDNPFVDGTKLQLPVYALAARRRFGEDGGAARAQYWFVRKDRGRRELSVGADVEQRYGETVGVLVDAIAAGLFPAKTPEGDDFAFVQCPYCNPDGAGYGDLRDAWERKQLDPLLRPLVRLIAPASPAAVTDPEVDA